MKAKLAETLTSWNPSLSAIKEAPIVIMACAELGKSGFKEGIPSTDKGDWYISDVCFFKQHSSLAAHSSSLGTVHVGAFDAWEAAKILNVPQGVNVVERYILR